MPGDTTNLDAARARVLVEKKTVINLLEAFAVAVKHYLRGEDGIHYQDLYHLVSFLPAYALPRTIPSKVDVTHMEQASEGDDGPSHHNHTDLPLPVSASGRSLPMSPTSPRPSRGGGGKDAYSGDDRQLLPARNPPKYSVFDLFPFSLLIKALTRRGREIGGVKAARFRAKRRGVASHNIPLEISLYLVRHLVLLGSPCC